MAAQFAGLYADTLQPYSFHPKGWPWLPLSPEWREDRISTTLYSITYCQDT